MGPSIPGTCTQAGKGVDSFFEIYQNMVLSIMQYAIEIYYRYGIKEIKTSGMVSSAICFGGIFFIISTPLKVLERAIRVFS